MRRLFSRSAVTVFLSVFSAAVFLQAQDHVLEPGRPPLTSDLAVKVAGFFEWTLDLHFTPEQSEEFERRMGRDWIDPAKRKSTLDLIPMIDKLAASPSETRERGRSEFRRSFLDGLRKTSPDNEARWILTIYDAAHPANLAEGSAAPARNITADTSRLNGKWRSSSAASTQYKNSYTGALAPTSGNSFSYEFLPDGTYRNNGLMQITTYGCTSSVFAENSGRYRIDGDRLYIEPSQGVVKSHTCGGQPSEKPDNLTVRVYAFHFESSGGRETLVINGVDAKTRPDYFHRER